MALATKQRLGKVQSAILEHVRGLGPKAKATTEDLRQVVSKATGKAVGNTSLHGAIRSLRQQGLVGVSKVGREIRVSVKDSKAGVAEAANSVEGTARRAIRGARAATAAVAASHTAQVIGTKLAPGESVILHVERDAVHVLENVHGRIEHRKVSRKG